jgi:hypothetical protein
MSDVIALLNLLGKHARPDGTLNVSALHEDLKRSMNEDECRERELRLSQLRSQLVRIDALIPEFQGHPTIVEIFQRKRSEVEREINEVAAAQCR